MRHPLHAAAPAALILLFGVGPASAQINSTSKAPIDITADTAEVVSSKCMTIWKGSAEALQDKSRLRADTLTVFARVKNAGANGQADCGSTERIEATGHVYYVTPDQNARGDRAVYSAAADQIVMTGNVIVVQGTDVARGEKLTIKVSTREARMESGGGAHARVRAVIYPDKTPAPAQGAKP